MISKKLRDNIDVGLWARYGRPDDDYIAAVGPSQENDGYIITFRRGEMPAFSCEQFGTLGALETIMRKFEPDMRKWHTRS